MTPTKTIRTLSFIAISKLRNGAFSAKPIDLGDTRLPKRIINGVERKEEWWGYLLDPGVDVNDLVVRERRKLRVRKVLRELNGRGAIRIIFLVLTLSVLLGLVFLSSALLHDLDGQLDALLFFLFHLPKSFDIRHYHLH